MAAGSWRFRVVLQHMYGPLALETRPILVGRRLTATQGES